MSPKPLFRILPLLLLASSLVLSSCTPAAVNLPVPTPVVTVAPGGVDNPNVFVDLASLQPALLQAINTRDTAKLHMWMTAPFLTGTWRGDLSEVPPAEEVKTLYDEQLGADPHLEVVKDADLKALLGGKDPLSIPRSDAGVMYTFLVSGWGKDGRDEAVFFVSRLPNDELKWHGWMQVKGGFSGARLGGIQFYQNEVLGFSAYVPKDYQLPAPDAENGMFLAPGQGHPDDNRAAALFSVEPANGRTAEQVATQLAEKTKTEMGSGYNGADITVMVIDGEPAYAVGGLPGQDINRQVFIVHNDRLYQLMFVPDSPRAAAYLQMEDIYAMLVNTWHFTQ